MTTKMSKDNAKIKSPMHKKAAMPKARKQTPAGVKTEAMKQAKSWVKIAGGKK